MPPIKHTQLFDFPAYTQALKEIKQETVDFGKSMGEVIKRLEADQKRLNIGLKEYADILKSFNVTQNSAAEKLKKYNAEIDENITKQTQLKAVMTSMDVVLTAQKATVQNVTTEYRELRKEYNSLRPGQKNFAEDQERIKTKVRQSTDALKANSDQLRHTKNSVDAAEGSYKRMQQELGALRTRLRELPGAFDPITGKINKNNKEAQSLIGEINRLDTTLKKADSQMGLYFRNVGNYKSALGGLGGVFGKVLGSIGALIGVNSAFEGLNFILNVNKDVNSLNASLKLVSGTQQEFGRNQQFLTRVADDYGLRIEDISKSFKNFYAAATTANIAAEDTRGIFDRVSKVAGLLQLSQEDVNGVFTAFGQIASKGTVQSEELRGQIGERIPGAFNIAAKAMGVTTAQLGDMLKKGEVMANDFLPKFALQLEKTFAGNAPSRIETLQANINRFSNSLRMLATSSDLTSFFSSFVSGVTGMIDAWNELTALDPADELRTEQAEVNALVNSIIAANDNQELRNELITRLNIEYPEFLQNLNAENLANEDLRRVLDLVNQQYERRIANATRASALDIFQKQREEALRASGGALKGLQQGAFAFGIDASTTDFNDPAQVTALAKQLDAAKERVFQSGEATSKEIVETGQKLKGAFDSLGFFDTKNFETLAETLIDANKSFTVAVGNADHAQQDLTKQRQEQIAALRNDLTVLENLQKKGVTVASVDLQSIVGKNKERIFKDAQDIELTIAQLRSSLDELTGPRRTIKLSSTTESGGKAAEKALKRFKDSIREQQKLLENAAELDIKQQELRFARKEINETKFQENKLDITRRFIEAAIAAELKLGKNADLARIDDYKKRLTAQQLEYEKFLQKQDERMNAGVRVTPVNLQALPDGGKVAKSPGEKAIEAVEKRAQAAIDAENKAFEIIQAGRDTSFREEIAHLERLKKIRLQYKQSTTEEEYAIERLNAEREKQLRQETEQFIFDAISTGLQILQETSSANIQSRIDNLEQEKQRELKLAGSNAVAREAIEKQYNQRINKEKRKQAQQDKMFALFNVAINTATGVVKSIAQWGMPLAIPFIALTIGTGLLQAALIASRPLPAFRKGTKNAPRGLAVTGEDGFELIQKKSGEMYRSANGPALTMLEGGERIFTHDESKRMLERSMKAQEAKQLSETAMLHGALAAQIRKGKQLESIDIMSQAMQKGGISKEQMREIMKEAMAAIVIERNIWDERGYHKQRQEANMRITELNNRYSL